MKETLIIVLFRGDFWCSSVIILSSDKYSSQFGGGSQYAYFHEEDETSFQLVDTAKTQKTAYQRNRMRFAQVRQTHRMLSFNLYVSIDFKVLSAFYVLFELITWRLSEQRNLRRDKDRRNLTQFNMQTLPKSAKQKERWDSFAIFQMTSCESAQAKNNPNTRSCHVSGWSCCKGFSLTSCLCLFRDRMRLQKKFQKQFGVRQKWDQKSQVSIRLFLLVD